MTHEEQPPLISVVLHRNVNITHISDLLKDQFDLEEGWIWSHITHKQKQLTTIHRTPFYGFKNEITPSGKVTFILGSILNHLTFGHISSLTGRLTLISVKQWCQKVQHVCRRTKAITITHLSLKQSWAWLCHTFSGVWWWSDYHVWTL